jgi:hypothetical protein
MFCACFDILHNDPAQYTTFFLDNIIIAWVIALSSVGLNQINVRALSEKKHHCKNNHGNSNLCSNALNYQIFFQQFTL